MPGRRSALLFSATLACSLPLGPAPTVRAAESGARRLVDALADLEARGLRLVYSSAVVPDDLIVAREPPPGDSRAALDELLRPHLLRAVEGPAGTLLIVPAPAGRPAFAGRVVSRRDGRPIAGACVRAEGTVAAVTTDARGEFRLVGGVELPAIVVEAEGHLPGRLLVPPGSAPVTIELEAVPLMRHELVVTARGGGTANRGPSGLEDEGIASAPAAGGDPARAAALLPGVAASGSSAAVHRRGGLVRDLAVVLDGVELLDPYHLRGLQSPFSVVDGGLAASVELVPAGLRPDLPGRLAGHLVVTSLGPGEQGGGSVEAGTLHSRAEIRLGDGARTAQLVASARVWYPEAVFAATELGRGERIDPRYADAYFKAGWRIGERHRLGGHLLLSRDRLILEESGEAINESVRAGATAVQLWLRDEASWSERHGGETRLALGRVERDRSGVAAVAAPIEVVDRRRVAWIEAAHRSALDLGGGTRADLGVSLGLWRAEYDYRRGEAGAAAMALATEPRGAALAAHASLRTRLGRVVDLEIGARAERAGHAPGGGLSPRLALTFRPREGIAVRAAASRVRAVHGIADLDVEDGETVFRRAEIQDAVEMAFERRWRSGTWLGVSAYRQRAFRLRPRYENLFEPIDLFPEAAEDRVRVAAEQGRLDGIEISAGGGSGSGFGWSASYARSSAKDRVAGQGVARSWDQPHALQARLALERGGWSAGLAGSVHSGWPTTPGVVAGPQGDAAVRPGRRNSARFPTYLRVDASVRREVSIGRGRMSLRLDVANLTDRRNPCCVNELRLETGPDGAPVAVADHDDWLGFRPALSLRWEW